MLKKIQQSITNLIVVFMLQAFLLVSMSYAQIDYSADSYLSPALNISIPNFDQVFNDYFLEQARILKQPDTVQARASFENNLYKLPFKSLFPQIIQYKLLNTINQNLLKDINRQEIIEISIDYVSDDYIYQLFKQQGEKKLSDLIGNEKLKQSLLPIKQTRNGEWIALEGYNPPSKKRAKPETIENYKRKWLLDSIPAVSGYTKKQLKELATGALWKMYFEYKLCHEFGKRLVRDVKDNRPAEFKINISLKNKKSIQAKLTVTGENYSVIVDQPESIDYAVLNTDGFEQRIEKIGDEDFRQQMHMLQSQKQDLMNVVQAINLLKRIKNIDLAGWQNGVSANAKDKIKQDLTTLDAWLAQSPEYFKNRLQEKFQAHLLIELIVKKRGKLALNNFSAVIDNLTEAISFLEARTIFLFQGISKRNASLLEYAVESKDDYFYTEFIKNELNIAQAAVENDLWSIALGNIEYLESEILKDSVVENEKALYAPAIEAIKQIRQKLDKADDVKLTSIALGLINQVEADKQQAVAEIVVSLTSAKQWLEKRYLTGYAQEISTVLSELDDAFAQDVSLYMVIHRALNQIDQLTEKVNVSDSAKMSPKFKQMIIDQFVSPKQLLKKFETKVSLRNKAIKKALPEYKIISLDQTIELLKNDFQRKSGYDSYALMQADLLELMRYAVKTLVEKQNGFSRGQGLIPVREIIPVVFDRLTKPLLEVKMIGQAI